MTSWLQEDVYHMLKILLNFLQWRKSKITEAVECLEMSCHLSFNIPVDKILSIFFMENLRSSGGVMQGTVMYEKLREQEGSSVTGVGSQTRSSYRNGKI